MTAIEREDGAAILIAMMAVLLMTAIGTALVVSTSSETIIAANFRDGIEARYAASAMIERGMDELREVGDWSLVTGGLLQSSWIDGPATGARTLADGSAIDLTQVVNVANCRTSTSCSLADLAEVTPDRPWGVNNPQWKLYAYGRLRDMLAPATIASAYYVVLLVANGPSPSLLAVRAEAFGSRGAHAAVELTEGRIAVSGGATAEAVRVLSWREVR
jgi:hypothetical protein